MQVTLLGMQLVPLTTPEEVDTFLAEHPLSAIFKAGTCHKTMQGFSVVEQFLKKHDLPVGFIRVVEWRPASNHVAGLTQITHHSPQFIVFKDQKAVFDADNWDITPEALSPVFEEYVPVRQDQAGEVKGELTPYIDLTERFLKGELTPYQYQTYFTDTFRADGSLRSKQEFELLSRMFGDPDAFHGGLHSLGNPSEDDNMKQRAAELLEALKALS